MSTIACGVFSYKKIIRGKKIDLQFYTIVQVSVPSNKEQNYLHHRLIESFRGEKRKEMEEIWSLRVRKI